MSDFHASAPLELTQESFDRFCRCITSELGIKMSDAKLPLLQNRLQRRLRMLEIDSLEEYQEYLFNSPQAEEEHVHFIDAITTNKTDFFREPAHFNTLVEKVLPTLDPLRAASAKVAPWLFKLWCAGCSSGEEPYTLAMVLSDFARQRPGFDFTVLATDISTRVLNHAQLGIYDEERIEPVPPMLRQRYLLRSRDRKKPKVRIVPELRQKITFRRLNFMDAHYGTREMFEVIFFRNVMIYFEKTTQKDVIQKLCRNLVPGGYLFVGHSESLGGLELPLTAISLAVYRKPL